MKENAHKTSFWILFHRGKKQTQKKYICICERMEANVRHVKCMLTNAPRFVQKSMKLCERLVFVYVTSKTHFQTSQPLIAAPRGARAQLRLIVRTIYRSDLLHTFIERDEACECANERYVCDTERDESLEFNTFSVWHTKTECHDFNAIIYDFVSDGMK